MNNEIDKRIEIAHGASIAHFGAFNAEALSLAIDAFAGSALVVDALVERAATIQEHPHATT